jgi:hypothetical protein
MKLSKVILTISLDSFGLLQYEMSFGLLIVGFVIHGWVLRLSRDYGLMDFG